MAAGEHQLEPFVRDGIHVGLFVRGQGLQPRQQLGLPLEGAFTSDAVDRAVAGCRQDPAAGIRRLAVALPPLERNRERVLERVLGEIEVAENAREDRERASPLLLEDGLDYGRASTSAGS